MHKLNYFESSFLAISLALVLFIGGCISSGGNGPLSSTTTTENAILKVYCTDSNCTEQQRPIGEGSLVHGCYASSDRCFDAIVDIPITTTIITTVPMTTTVNLTTTIQNQDYYVNISNFAFQPNQLKVSAGSTVIWTNREAAPHDIAIDTGISLAGFGSPMLSNGQSYNYTFTTAGNFTYHCGVHPSMKGTILVE